MWTKGFFLSLLANFAYWVCFFFHVALYPLFLDRQGLDSTTLSNVLAVVAVGAVAGRLVSGWAIDQWGAKPFIVFGGLMMAAASPPMVMTNHLGLLYGLRMLVGFSFGIFTNATLAHITYITPVENRGRAVSWWGIMNNIANALVPPLAFVLLAHTSFLAAFTVSAAFALAGGVIGLTLPRAGSKPTPVLAGEFHAPVVSLTGEGNPSEVQPLHPVRTPFRVLVRPAIFPGIIAGTIGFALAAFISFAPLIAEQIGLPNPGFYLTAYAGANIIGQLTAGPISDRLGRRWVILPGFALAAGGMGLLGFVGPAKLGLLVPFVLGLGTGSGLLGILAWAVDLVKPEEKGLASSTVLVMWEIFVFSGIAFQGRMVQAGNGAVGFQMMAGLIAAALALYSFSLWAAHRKALPQEA